MRYLCHILGHVLFEPYQKELMMLALTRRTGEVVFLDVPPSTEPRRIAVMVVHSTQTKSKLGFSCDRDVTIKRSEITETN
jgi:sRNA-binding carbon storage regulator CsrA